MGARVIQSQSIFLHEFDSPNKQVKWQPRGAVLSTRGDLGVGALGGDPVTGSGTQLAAEGPC